MDALQTYYEHLLSVERQLNRWGGIMFAAVAGLLAITITLHTKWVDPDFIALTSAEKELNELRAELINYYGEETLQKLDFNYFFLNPKGIEKLTTNKDFVSIVHFDSTEWNRENLSDVLKYYRKDRLVLYGGNDLGNFQFDVTNLNRESTKGLSFLELKSISNQGNEAAQQLYSRFEEDQFGFGDVLRYSVNLCPEADSASLGEIARRADSLVKQRLSQYGYAVEAILGATGLGWDDGATVRTLPLAILRNYNSCHGMLLRDILKQAAISDTMLREYGIQHNWGSAPIMNSLTAIGDIILDRINSRARDRASASISIFGMALSIPVVIPLSLIPFICLFIGAFHRKVGQELDQLRSVRWQILVTLLKSPLNSDKQLEMIEPIPPKLWIFLTLSDFLAAWISCGLIVHIVISVSVIARFWAFLIAALLIVTLAMANVAIQKGKLPRLN